MNAEDALRLIADYYEFQPEDSLRSIVEQYGDIDQELDETMLDEIAAAAPPPFKYENSAR